MIKFRTTITYIAPADVCRRKTRETVRDELADLGDHWYRKYLPLHLTRSAYSLYPAYTRRSRAYERRKGNELPQVQTGKHRALVLGGAQITATLAGKVRVRFQGARATNLWGFGKKHNFTAELTATNTAEANRFARRTDDGLVRRYQKIRETRKVSV